MTLGIGFVFIILLLVVRIHVRSCTQLSGTITGLCVAVASLLFIASLGAAFYRHRHEIKNIRRHIRQVHSIIWNDEHEDEAGAADRAVNELSNASPRNEACK